MKKIIIVMLITCCTLPLLAQPVPSFVFKQIQQVYSQRDEYFQKQTKSDSALANSLRPIAWGTGVYLQRGKRRMILWLCHTQPGLVTFNFSHSLSAADRETLTRTSRDSLSYNLLRTRTELKFRLPQAGSPEAEQIFNSLQPKLAALPFLTDIEVADIFNNKRVTSTR